MEGRLIWEFTEKLKAADDSETAGRILIDTVRAFGYDDIVYALMPRDGSDEIGEYVGFSSLSPDWMQFYAECDLHRTDSLVHHCFRENRPILWSEYNRNVDHGLIPQDQIETAHYARDWGVVNGVTIPLQQVGNYVAGISLIADKDVDAHGQEREFLAHRKLLIALVDAFHAHVDRKNMAINHYRLTRREIEVLKWLSEGFQEKQIAHRLGTSIHTVEKQVKSAKRRMHAATSTQAAVKAAMLGVFD